MKFISLLSPDTFIVSKMWTPNSIWLITIGNFILCVALLWMAFLCVRVMIYFDNRHAPIKWSRNFLKLLALLVLMLGLNQALYIFSVIHPIVPLLIVWKLITAVLAVGVVIYIYRKVLPKF